MATAVMEKRRRSSRGPKRRFREESQRVLLHDVSWDQYIAIGNALPDRPKLRLTYDRGSLEFMVTSFEHDFFKFLFGIFIHVICEECKLPYIAAGSMTFQKKELEEGFEPDQYFWIQHQHQM